MIDQKDAIRYKKHLRNLTVSVALGISLIDEEMEKPSNPDRGQRIATIANALEMQNDQAWHFGLGLNLKKKKF
ncbi:hypothetical protein ES708_00722 [subsurface metagenome]